MRYRLSLLIVAGLLCCQAGAQSRPLPARFVEALRTVNVPLEATGVYVQELGNGAAAPLLDWHSEPAMQPASTMKLVTSYAALDLLGPAYTWKTQVYTTGSMTGDVLNGDLILQGGGDPHLVLENFWMLLRQIRAKGIREIRGNLVIDSSWMLPQPFDAADFDGDPTRPYNVGPDATLINFNALELQLHPDRDGLHVQSATPVALEINVSATIDPGRCADWRSSLHPVFSMRDGQMQLRLSGHYAQSCGDKIWTLQPYPLSPADFDAALFRGLWKELGGQWQGQMQTGPVPVAAALLTTWNSAPLHEILRNMNKYSNNVMTRLVMLTLDHEAHQSPASVERAAQLVQDWFARLGIATQGLQLENGSGLSRLEQISVQQMGRMLVHAWGSPFMPELLSSLPLAGADGSMRNRVAGLEVASHAHIKTGGLDGVRNIAGYVLAASGRRYAVVCFVNDPHAKQAELAQDLVLQWIYEHG